jgi:hypothetical protein
MSYTFVNGRDVILTIDFDSNTTFLPVACLTSNSMDIKRDAIYTIKFYETIFKSLSDNTFNYSQQKVASKDFTTKFTFN